MTVNPLPERVAAVRRDGVGGGDAGPRVARHRCRAMPWLLAGAKTLSYAVNMAALRHAARQGAGDVIFVSSDGYMLEGPRSTVVIATDRRRRQRCLLTPPPWYPILRGTTQQALFERRPRQGLRLRLPRAAGRGSALRPRDLVGVEHDAGGPGAHPRRPATAADRRWPRNSPNWSTPRSSATAERGEIRLSGVAGRGYGRPYTGKEVVREIDSLWTCEVAAR